VASCGLSSPDADRGGDGIDAGASSDETAVARSAATAPVAQGAPDRLGATAPVPPGNSPTCLADTAMVDFQTGVLTNCDATTSPGDVRLALGPQIDQQNTTVTANGFGFTATSWAGQTFIPSVTGPLLRVDLDLFCSGCSGTIPNLTVALRATTGSPGIPTGADLATATISGFSNNTGTYFSATFATPATVTAGTQYAVVMHPQSNPSAGVYAYVCSCTTSTNPYTSGSRVTSANSGGTWTADVTAGGRDLGFAVFIGSGFAPSGNLVSSNRDANPSASDTVHWTTLSWTATTPAASTTLQFQAAASNTSTGPFNFVGPDGTTSTFFTSGDSLSQFDGNRYLEYKALFTSSDITQTATLQDVTACFTNGPTTVSTTLVANAASAAFGATVDLSAVLSGGGAALAGRTVSFSLNGNAAGTGTTDATGTATVTGASLTGIEPGSYPGAISASYDGETGFGASSGSADLTVTQAAQTISFAVLPPKLMTDVPFTVSASGGASGNPVTFSTSSSACSVTGSTVTLVAAGACAVQADQAGNTEYTAAAPVTRSFTISLASQTITFPPIASFSWSGGSATLAATASSSLAVAYSVQSGPCSIAGTTITATAAGTCVVAADQAGNGTYSAAPEVTASVTVTTASQTITFGPLSNKLMTSGPFTVTATGGGSGNPVTFSTSTPTRCSVSGSTVTLVSAGTCAVRADQAGNANYAAATQVTQSFTISQATQTITFPVIASFSWSSGSAVLSATASSGLVVAYTVQSGPCSLAGTTLTASAAGTCVIAANQSGNTTYSAAAQVTASVAVTKASQTINFGPLSSKLMTDGAFTVSATGGGSGNPVTFSSSSSACSVAGTTVTLVAAGTCAIQADQAGNANYLAAAPVTQSFTISRATQTITFPPIASFSWSGGSATLAATASSGLAVSYSVISGPCSVAGTTLTATATGVCGVTADQAGNASYAAAVQVASMVVVTKASQVVSFAALPDKLMTDSAFAVSATGGGSGNPVTFSTSSAACSVTGSTVTLVSAGTCAIQADQAGNAEYTAAAPVTQSFTISLATQTITFPAIASFSWSGGSATLAATASSSLAVAYSVQSGPCSIAGFTLSAVGAGTCVIAANQPGNGSYSAAPQTTAGVTVTKGAQTIAFPPIANFSWSSGAVTLAATASSGLAVAYSVQSGPCSVSGSALTATAPGTCVVAADQPGNANYLAAEQATTSAVVTSADQTITFPPIADFSWGGGSATLAATASSGLTVSYSVQSGPCSVAGTTLTATGAGSCVVAADQPGDSSYASAVRVTQTAAVARADQTIEFGALVDHPATDPAFAVSATGGGSTSPVTFSTSSTACSVSGSTVTLVSAGSCAIQASQAADANYNAAEPVTQSFAISFVAQTIAFPAVAAFSWHGGIAVLSATASSALAVSYSVISGPCVLAGSTLTATTAGTCVIAADQVGNGSYAAAEQATISVTVNRADQTITFPEIDVFPASGGSAKLAATASSGLPVSYAVRSGPCTVAGDTLTATAAGTCEVMASQAGDSSYNPALAVTSSVTIAATDNGCGCHSTSNGGVSGAWILIVGAVLRRRRRAAR
jgi:hypothetical protein